MSLIKGLEVTEYEPTAPMVDIDTKPVLGPPARLQVRKAQWLEQLDRIEAKLDLDSSLVFSAPHVLSVDIAERIKGAIEAEFPGRKCAVISGDCTLQTLGQSRHLQRIEQKLDALIKALAEDEEPEGTLDESGPVDPGKVQGL